MPNSFVQKDVIEDKTFRFFFDNSAAGQVITFPSSEILANKAFLKMLGYTKKELEGKKWKDIFDPEDFITAQKRLDQILLKGKGADHAIYRFIKKDNTRIWVDVHTNLYLDGRGPADIMMSTIIDITQRVRAELELKKSRELYTTFINSTRDMIYLKDENFRHLISNKALADFFGVETHDIIQKTDYELGAPEYAELCRKTDIEALNSSGPALFIEDYNGRVLEARKFPVSLGEGKTGVGAYIRDITKERMQQEKLDKLSDTNRIIAECMMRPFVNTQEHLDYALNEAVRLTESKYGFIYLYDEGRTEFIINSWSSEVLCDCSVAPQQAGFQLHSTGIWGEVVRQRRPIIVNDFEAPNRLKRGYPQGHVIISKFMSVPLYDNGKIVAAIGLANKNSDYTEDDIHFVTILMAGVWNTVKKREKERETEILLERTQAMFNHHEAPMLLIEPNSGRIIDANAAAVNFHGYSKEELLSMYLQDINILSNDELTRQRQLTSKKEQIYFTLPHRLKSGEIRIVDVYSSPIEYNNERLVFSIIIDVTKREEAKKQIEYLAYHDYLTGLYNRRYFDEAYLKLMGKESFPLAIILGDINGLKLINDSFGHSEGDKAIRAVAERIKECLTGDEILARIGGDEFALITIGKDRNKLKELMYNIEEYVNNQNKNRDRPFATVSFGYSIQRSEDDGMDALLKEAEAFMYSRKYYDSRSVRSRTVSVIMNTLFEKSAREESHSKRVGRICELIALKLQLDQQYINKIRVAGFLHDIGKIGISEEILNKSGKLDNSEWEIMKRHSEKGARILENSVEYRDIAEIVLFHHEHFDGSGYPKGLKGKEIPIESRIIAVADTYDAMTNERPYRKILSKEDAIRELKSCSGSQLDPEIVRLFISEVINDSLFSEGTKLKPATS
ncbi:MAG: PAS domain S-box protein [Oscillospiraceae bacterium]|jgi:diguanylate cyclase (GGDEF)-like protein/PAS domain S-box-containing protein/putative nucleotidyltransferase with HDIG domain